MSPTLTQGDFDRARFRVGERDVTRAQWQQAVRARTEKARIDLLLDTPIIEHFKALAGEGDYQASIDETLRRAIQAEHMEVDLRRIVREELDARGR